MCTSVHVAEHLSEDTEVPDVGSMLQLYGNKGIDFVVDVGPRIATESTVSVCVEGGERAGYSRGLTLWWAVSRASGRLCVPSY